MQKCKECGQDLPTGRNLLASLGLCEYCYKMHYPKRPKSNLPTLWQGIAHPEPLLSYNELRRMEREQFEGREEEIWSEDFLEEWEEYLEAKERGELRI